MKIALIAPELLPNWGGVGTYCVELARHLSENKNIEVHVVTLARQIKGSKINYTESDILDFFKNKISLHIVANAKETFLYNSEFQYQLSRKLPRIIRENRIELLHSQHAHMSDILFKLRNDSSTRIPTVTTIHSTIKTQFEGIKATQQKWSEMDSSEKYEIALYFILRTIERYCLMKRNNNINIFVSNWTKKHVQEKYKFSNLDGPVIHNGVDTNQYGPNKYSASQILRNVTDPIILYASRLTVARGAHVLAHAIPKILTENKEVHFVFAGSGNPTSVLEILKANNVPKEKYTILGYVDYKDLPCLYARSFAYVMPTSWENLPFKLLEAMSSAVPVITTNVGGIPEVVQNGYNGFFTSRDPRGIAANVNQLLCDPKLARNVGCNARKTIIDNFTWAKVVGRTIKVYENLLGDAQSNNSFPTSKVRS